MIEETPSKYHSVKSTPPLRNKLLLATLARHFSPLKPRWPTKPIIVYSCTPPPTQMSLPEGAGPDVPFQHSLRSLPIPCTLRDALSHRLDLQAPLRRPVLRALSECCRDAAERAWMELLCAKTSGCECLFLVVCLAAKESIARKEGRRAL